MLAETAWSDPAAAGAPRDGVEALNVLVQGDTIPSRTLLAASQQHRSRWCPATPSAAAGVALKPMINQSSASRTLSQNPIVRQVTRHNAITLVQVLAQNARLNNGAACRNTVQ